MKNRIIKNLRISIPAAALLGGVVCLVNPGEKPFLGWLGSTILSFIFLFVIIFAVEKLHSPKQVKTITTVNLVVRIIAGVALFLLLPIWGYEEEPPQAGYLYLDAYRRDADAWQIANTDESTFTGFQDEFYTDQYGGMLSLSASIYRVFSPDAHRPILILLLTSFVSTLGIPFYWQAIQERFGSKVANLACWVLALYPESVILGGSQMREPLIIGLSGIILWGLEYRKKNKRAGTIALISSMLVLTVISTRYAIAVALLLALWMWSDYTTKETTKDQKIKIWKSLPLVVIVLAGLFISWRWLVDTSRWDLYLMESSSGRVQFELDTIGEQLRIPFLVLYGVLQPVLPAAIAYPGIAIMRIIAIFRSAGWYLIAPTLLLAPFFTPKEKNNKNRQVLILTTLFILFWILLSSLRAGGDQWDNPRYRTAILPWIAIVASWTFIYFKDQKNPWLKRTYAVITVFCLFFLQWYLSRYYKLWTRLPFVQMVIVLCATILVLVIGFLIHDRLQRKSIGK
ncbi:MAG: hypothetical protein ACYC59_02430 [Anaerolineaceae bacterium]